MDTGRSGGRLLTVAEVAERLRIGQDSAYRLCRQDHFPAMRVGGLIRIPEDALDRWIEREAFGSHPELGGGTPS